MVVGPLATFAEPHCYDLCAAHSARMVPPRGWELVTLETDPLSLLPSTAELDALAAVVRQAGSVTTETGEIPAGGRRGHLSVVRD